MPPSPRVFVTGIGVISALGRGCAAHVEAVSSSRSGIRELTSLDVSSLRSTIGGEVRSEDIGDEYKQYDRFTQFALIAAEEAAAMGRLSQIADRTRIATLLGSGLGGSTTLDDAYVRLYLRDAERLPPLTIPRAMYNAGASAVAAHCQALGPSYTIVSACSSATHAIGQAFHWIRSGMADVAIAGGSDAPLTYGVIRGWEALRVLAATGESPAEACRPFSADRSGMVLAEGGGVLLLESERSARRRDIPPLGEMIGFGLSSDGGHVTDPSPDGAARAMQFALADGTLSPEEIAYVNAHGTGTRANDPAETAAIRTVFGAHAERLAVSSTKSMHGHAMGASGAIEAALSLAALNSGWIPPTINYRQADPACDLDYVPNQARRAVDVRLFMSNSFGFGGMNGSIILRTRTGLDG